MVRYRILGFVIGVAYGLGLAIFTMLLTGGGHGNFLWPTMFFNTTFFGLIYPILGVFVFGLRSAAEKFIVGFILAVHFIFFTLFVFAELTNPSSGPRDTINFTVDPFASLIIVSLFVWPQLLCVFLLIRRYLIDGVNEEDK